MHDDADEPFTSRRDFVQRVAAGATALSLVSTASGAARDAAAAAGSAPGSQASLWHEFCDQLKRAGEQILRPEAPKNPFDQAEGFRYLTRLLRYGLESSVEYSDPQFPVLYSATHSLVKIGADNPDNIYHSARLSGRHTYRISGRRGTVNYIGFSTKAGGYGKDGTLGPTGFLDTQRLEVKPDGRFEILVSAARQPGNWLPMTEQTTTLIVRQTFLDRAHEQPAELAIEALDAPRAPAPLDPEVFARQLMGAAAFVQGTARVFADWSQIFKAHPNDFTRQDQSVYTRAGGDPTIFYAHGYWELRPDQALIVEVPPLESEFWNFQVDNYWMESLDYRYHRIHVNKHTARFNPDGSATLVVAHRDPGRPNWLETVGHAAGTMLFRVVGGKKEIYPQARVIES